MQGGSNRGVHDQRHCRAGCRLQEAPGHALGHIGAVCGLPNQAGGRARPLCADSAGPSACGAYEASVHVRWASNASLSCLAGLRQKVLSVQANLAFLVALSAEGEYADIGLKSSLLLVKLPNNEAFRSEAC